MSLEFGGRRAYPEDSDDGSAEVAEADEATVNPPYRAETAPELSPPRTEPESEDDCPSESHLHVTANRRFGGTLAFMDIGNQIVTGKDPWNFSSHCPECGALVKDRNSRRFRCTSDGCAGRWEISRDQVKGAREAARHSILGEEFVMLSPEAP